MEKNHFPLPISFEEDIGFLVVFFSDFSVFELGANAEDVTRDGGIAARAYLNVHVAQLHLFDAIPCPNIFGPLLFVGRKIGATLGKVLRKVIGVEGEILRKVVGLVGGVGLLFHVANFPFRRI
jgi:hypothetical protein